MAVGKKDEYKPIIAKGKRSEVLKDKLQELGELIVDIVVDNWKMVLVGGAMVLGVVLATSLILQRSEQKKIENFVNFERAFAILSFERADQAHLEEALRILQNTDESLHISKIYRAWALFKLKRKEEALKELNDILDDERVPYDLRKIAAMMKINITGRENCKDVIETYEKLRAMLPSLAPIETENKGYIFTIPIRTYLEVARCAKGRPDIVQKMIAELDTMYYVEQFISAERAKNILIAKQVIAHLASKQDSDAESQNKNNK